MPVISQVERLLALVGDDPEALSLIISIGELLARRGRERRRRHKSKTVQSD